MTILKEVKFAMKDKKEGLVSEKVEFSNLTYEGKSNSSIRFEMSYKKEIFEY